MYERHFSWRMNHAARYTSRHLVGIAEESNENWFYENSVDVHNIGKAKPSQNSAILSIRRS